MFHFHRYGAIDNGYQYCLKCGIARPVPCGHIWQEKRAIILTHRETGNKRAIGYIFAASSCLYYY